jgi:fructose-1,6-bisphosphatase/sedoheptulose 1,7-bisphosphatase-like protein
MIINNITETETIVKDAEYYRKKIGIKKKNPKELDILFNKLNENIEKMAESSGLTVDELIDALDPSKPFPF